MNIGITCYPTYGGSGIVATELGLELANRGHEVHFITYSNPIHLDPGILRIHYHEVEVSKYPLFQYPPYCLALASRMAEVAEDYQLDLLHVHYAIPHSTAAMLAQLGVAAEWVGVGVEGNLVILAQQGNRSLRIHLAQTSTGSLDCVPPALPPSLHSG